MKLTIEIDLSAHEAQQLIEGQLDSLQPPIQAALAQACQQELIEDMSEFLAPPRTEADLSVKQFCAAEIEYCNLTEAGHQRVA